MHRKSLIAVAVCTAALAGASASAAFAGEVKGPPLAPGETGTPTAGPEHANSACVFSGLNDNPFSTDPTNPGGMVQTPAGSRGAPGHGGVPGFPIGCRGGSNPQNPPSP